MPNGLHFEGWLHGLESEGWLHGLRSGWTDGWSEGRTDGGRSMKVPGYDVDEAGESENMIVHVRPAFLHLPTHS